MTYWLEVAVCQVMLWKNYEEGRCVRSKRAQVEVIRQQLGQR